MAPIYKACHWCPTSPPPPPQRCRHQMQKDQAGYSTHKCTSFIFLSWCRVLSCLWVSSLGPAAPEPPCCTFLAPNLSSTLTCWNLTAKALTKDPLCPIILSGCFVSQEYGPCTFWLNMLDAAFQSLVCFFIPYLVSLAVGPACPIHPPAGTPTPGVGCLSGLLRLRYRPLCLGDPHHGHRTLHLPPAPWHRNQDLGKDPLWVELAGFRRLQGLI